MEINGSGADVRIVCSLDEVKDIYRALFRAMDLRSGDIDRADTLMDLQTFLYAEAGRRGVDLANHAEWERFLGTPEEEIRPCEIRYADYPFRAESG